MFDEILNQHLQFEGGYVFHPRDLGGETYRGISRRYHPNWKGWETIDRVKREGPDFELYLERDSALQEAVRDFYRETYWKPLNLDEIVSFDVARELFDIAAGPNGIGAAAKILQGSLLLLGQDVGPLDGVIGPRTIRAANTYPYPQALAKMMNCLQFTHLLLGNDNVLWTIEAVRGRFMLLRAFMRGWLRRIEI